MGIYEEALRRCEQEAQAVNDLDYWARSWQARHQAAMQNLNTERLYGFSQRSEVLSRLLGEIADLWEEARVHCEKHGAGQDAVIRRDFHKKMAEMIQVVAEEQAEKAKRRNERAIERRRGLADNLSVCEAGHVCSETDFHLPGRTCGHFESGSDESCGRAIVQLGDYADDSMKTLYVEGKMDELEAIVRSREIVRCLFGRAP